MDANFAYDPSLIMVVCESKRRHFYFFFSLLLSISLKLGGLYFLANAIAMITPNQMRPPRQ